MLDTGWRNDAVREALDLCLSCKACKTECPVNVDVATYKAEFLAHYYGDRLPNRSALRLRIHGSPGGRSVFDPGRHAAACESCSRDVRARRTPSKPILGVAQQRKLPQFAPRSFQSIMGEALRPNAPPDARCSCGPIPGTTTTIRNPCALPPRCWQPRASRSRFRAATSAAVVRSTTSDSSQQARAYLREVLVGFAPQIDAGMPFVFLEPSCASVFRDELINFFPTDARAQRLREQTLLLSEFLDRIRAGLPAAAAPRPKNRPPRPLPSQISDEDDRRSRASASHRRRGRTARLRLLWHGWPLRVRAREIRRLSGARRARAAARRARRRRETILVADGFSCREQISQNTAAAPSTSPKLSRPARPAVDIAAAMHPMVGQRCRFASTIVITTIIT